jgi:hypothetical protein
LARARWTRRSLAIALLVWSLSPRLASAEALVSVQLKDGAGQPSEGKVSLRDAAGKTIATCQARAGKCEMPNVPGGTFTVTVEPAHGSAPKPRKVLIPPKGKVALVLTSG